MFAACKLDRAYPVNSQDY